MLESLFFDIQIAYYKKSYLNFGLNKDERSNSNISIPNSFQNTLNILYV